MSGKVKIFDGSAGVDSNVAAAVTKGPVTPTVNDNALVVALSPNSDLNVVATIGGPIAAGTNLIGKVGVDQTTQGTTNNVTVSGNPVTYTDRSSTITSGGTSQAVAATNAARKGFLIQNNSGANLWINFGVAAVQVQPSLLLLPNAYFEMPLNGVSTQAVNVIGATTGQTFTAKEW